MRSPSQLPGYWNPFRVAAIMVLLALGGVRAARAQANIAIWGGAVAVTAGDNTHKDWGRGLGTILKFNVMPVLRLRGQFNVDKAQLGGNDQARSLTALCLGFGVEAAVGGRDVDVFVNLTPHGTIRTLFSTADDGGSAHIANLTRFSLGLTGGAGAEVFITDNIGFEGQVQYTIYNFDHNEADPRYHSVRLMVGLQFLLGRNFVR